MMRAVALLARLMLVMTACMSAAIMATPPGGTCFAVRPLDDRGGVPAAARCLGQPEGYQHHVLWLRLPLPPVDGAAGLALVVGTTRFERLTAIFVHADGRTVAQGVSRGAFGNRWHVGGQIAFGSPSGQAPLTAVWLRIEQLENYDLLRVHFLRSARLERQFETCAVLVGGAIALLAIAALYTLGLGVAAGRRFLLWHGLWAACVVAWGLVWSQLALNVLPSLAGTSSGRLATVLACLAILCATLSAMSALRPVLPVLLRWAIRGMGVLVVLLGLWADLPGADLHLIGSVMTVATLLTLAGVAASLIIAWRHGLAEARDLTFAWTVPMLTLAATQVVDFDTSLLGGGAQIAVLFASAFQTICLAVLATRRLSRLRVERDTAVAAGAALAELAERDALTGLLNRRGFIARCEQAFSDQRAAPFGLLLIDVDLFKSVNDRFGHETGDAVLVNLATQLRALEQHHLCLAGRLGGEEFVVGISGMPSSALLPFAEHVRDVLGRCDHGELSRHRTVTVSIGVAEGMGSGPFRALYGKADRALYEAKQAGRNRVVFKEPAAGPQEGQLILPLHEPG